jgi:small subunit ribosomal protein S20
VANHPQAKKRTRQRIKRTLRNRHIRATMRGALKTVRAAVDGGELAAAQEALKVAVKQLDRAVTKGVLHRRTASRTISRLTLAVNKLQA